MTDQNYLIVEANTVTNIVVWDGSTQTWTPPAGATMLVQATTPAMVWELDAAAVPPVYKLAQVMGVGGIGFTWDGTAVTTNEPQPAAPEAGPSITVTVL